MDDQKTRCFRQLLAISLFLLSGWPTYGQPLNSKYLVKLLNRTDDSLFQQVLNRPDKYRYQVIYTQIDRDESNRPTLTNYYARFDSLQYFYPASTVKMPLAFMSLEKLRSMDSGDIHLFTPIQILPRDDNDHQLTRDSTAENGLPTIAHLIKKIFLISDNDASNALFDFLGQQYINRRLAEMGYTDARIIRRFAAMNEEQNRYAPEVQFMNGEGGVIFSQPPSYNPDNIPTVRKITLGDGYFSNGELVRVPQDFTHSNRLSLLHLQQILQSVLFPETVAKKRRFRLEAADYQFLYRMLSQYPSETAYPKYDTSVFYDSYVKFFFQDSSGQMPPHVRVFNKVGWAYGCLTDVSYVADFKNQVEFMLSATIYVNDDGILNDDKYEYDSVGLPFLYRLGQTIYQHELKRRRVNHPDLSRFRMDYPKRPPDGRPSIKEANN